MSGCNVTCGITNQIGDGGGEVDYFDSAKSNIADIVAGEVVNDILENALDIATCTSQTSFTWNSSVDEVAKLDVNNLCSEIVGGIVEKVDVRPVNFVEGQNNADQELPLDKQIKRMLKVMMAPTYEIINHEGVGDQPEFQPEAEKETCEEICSKTIEKKSRVTDLVKNSPQIISEYLKMDEMTKKTLGKWEESEEKVLQVIELDYAGLDGEPFKAFRKYQPENVSLPDDDDDLISESSEDTSARKNENEAGQGDENKQDMIVVLPPPSEEVASEQKPEDDKPTSTRKGKKKKWNLGSRIWGFLKKGHKQLRGSQKAAGD